MGVKVQLGRLVRVPLRECWDREDTDFTPWLANDENIALLGETIGMELEVQAQEAHVGPFRAYILCRNTDDNTVVLIENQLEETDHGHLGQLLTYSAGFKAVTLVWIAEEFTDEHRAALDWLNERTDEDFNVFGLEIELWRIGDGTPAPKFNLVAKPNDWTRKVQEASKGKAVGLSTREALQVDYWTAFGEELRKRNSSWKSPKPSATSWVSYGVGRNGVGLSVNMHNQQIAIGVEVNSREHPGWFGHLFGQREAIEAETGFPLEWEERPGNKYSVIRVLEAIDMRDKANWPAALKWHIDRLEILGKVFRARAKALQDEVEIVREAGR